MFVSLVTQCDVIIKSSKLQVSNVEESKISNLPVTHLAIQSPFGEFLCCTEMLLLSISLLNLILAVALTDSQNDIL